MDYKAFFDDVEKWIQEVNQTAVRIGMDHSDFWIWVAESTSAVCRKYQDHRLVIMQMLMLVDWLEEVYEKNNRKKG